MRRPSTPPWCLLIGLFAAALLSWAGAAPLALQSTAVLQGRVLDQNAAVVPHARISAKNIATGLARIGETDSEGNYQIDALPVGYYRVEVSARGFKTEIAERLSIDVARIVVQDFRLEVRAQTVGTQASGAADRERYHFGRSID